MRGKRARKLDALGGKRSKSDARRAYLRRRPRQRRLQPLPLGNRLMSPGDKPIFPRENLSISPRKTPMSPRENPLYKTLQYKRLI